MNLASPASFDLHGFKLEGPAILVVALLLAIIAVCVGSLVWVSRDARKRNKNVFAALLFILLAGWPLSFAWWLWLRPSIKQNT